MTDDHARRTSRNCPLRCSSGGHRRITMEAHIVTDHGIDRRIAKALTERVFSDE